MQTTETYDPKAGHELEGVIDLLLEAEAEGQVVQIENYMKTNGDIVPLVEFYFPTNTYFQMFFLAHVAYEAALRDLESGEKFFDLEPEDAESLEASKEWKKVQDKIYTVLGEASKTGREDKYKSQGIHTASSESAIRRYGLGQHVLIPDDSSILLKGVLYTKSTAPEPKTAHDWIKWDSGLGRYRNLELRPGRFTKITAKK